MSEDEAFRDRIIDGIKNVAGDADAELLSPFRLPIDPMVQINLHSDNESLA